MTLEEFSNEFDVLANSYANSDPSDVRNFDEYEKSVFLSQAQESVVRELYASMPGFEDTEQVRRYLAPLVTSAEVGTVSYPMGVSPNSKRALLPDDLMFITYESARITGGTSCLTDVMVEVIPVSQDEFHRIRQNPFRQPNARKVLRLDLNVNEVELVSMYNVTKYYVRYLRRPQPIILVDLPDGLSISGGILTTYNTRTKCELNPDLHRMILDVAVANALKSRGVGNTSN